MKAVSHRTITMGALLCVLGLAIFLAGLVPSAYAAPPPPHCNTNNAPTVTIDPISSPICTGSTVTISGSAGDDHGLVSVLVTDSRGNSQSQSLSGTSATWSVSLPISADGLTTVTAKV